MRVSSAHQVELLAGHGEPMRGGAQGQALADDATLVVVLGVRGGGEATANVVDGAAGGLGELLEGHGVTVEQQPKQRNVEGGVEAGFLGVGEPAG